MNKLGRDWLKSPTSVLTTKFGRLEVLFNGGDRVKVANYMGGRSAVLNEDEQHGLVYRDQRFATELVVEQLDSGEWVPWRRRSDDGKTILDGEGTWAFVCRRPGIGGAPAPRTYAAAIKTEVLRAVREFLAQPEQALPLALGRQAELNNQAYHLEDEVKEMAEKLAAKRAELQGLLHGLDLVSRALTARARNA